MAVAVAVAIRSVRAFIAKGRSRIVLTDPNGNGEYASFAAKHWVFADGREAFTQKAWRKGVGWTHTLLTPDLRVVLARGMGDGEKESWSEIVKNARGVGYDLSPVFREGDQPTALNKVPTVYLGPGGNFKPGYDAKFKSDLVNSILGVPTGLMSFNPEDAYEFLVERDWIDHLDKARERRASAVAGPGEKVCSSCRIPKPYSEFNSNADHADGLQSACRECERNRRRERERAATA